VLANYYNYGEALRSFALMGRLHYGTTLDARLGFNFAATTTMVASALVDLPFLKGGIYV
jgi:hypothetical protein